MLRRMTSGTQQQQTPSALPLAGKVACVTGTGIGVGLAVALAQAGADVAVSYFGSEEGARNTVEQVEAAGRRALLYKADVAVGAEARALVDATVERLGRIDVMVNNSGVTWPKPFLELDERRGTARLGSTSAGRSCARSRRRST